MNSSNVFNVPSGCWSVSKNSVFVDQGSFIVAILKEVVPSRDL